MLKSIFYWQWLVAFFIAIANLGTYNLYGGLMGDKIDLRKITNICLNKRLED